MVSAKIKGLALIAIVVLLYYIIFESEETAYDIPDNNTVKWQTSYELEARQALPDYVNFVSDTAYYEYTNPIISEIGNEISRKSRNVKDAILYSLEYVYDNVEYTYNEPDSACIYGTASEILEKGTGQCDTQSILLISILRQQGIAATPVGGCIVLKPRCQLQAFIAMSFKDIFRPPLYTELEEPEITGDQFSRVQYARKGGLHAWVTAWVPDEGWLILEATSGSIADTSCYDYHVELFPSNRGKQDICISINFAYASACTSNNLEIMNKEGVGLNTEVEP